MHLGDRHGRRDGVGAVGDQGLRHAQPRAGGITRIQVVDDVNEQAEELLFGEAAPRGVGLKELAGVGGRDGVVDGLTEVMAEGLHFLCLQDAVVVLVVLVPQLFQLSRANLFALKSQHLTRI